MCVKNAKKASSELQKMQTTLSRNCWSKNAPKLSAVIHCLQWTTAKIALKMQWDFGHSGNMQNLQGNYLQCSKEKVLITSIIQLNHRESTYWSPQLNQPRTGLGLHEKCYNTCKSYHF